VEHILYRCQVSIAQNRPVIPLSATKRRQPKGAIENPPHETRKELGEQSSGGGVWDELIHDETNARYYPPSVHFSKTAKEEGGMSCLSFETANTPTPDTRQPRKKTMMDQADAP
jgi:hypothetical protein